MEQMHGRAMDFMPRASAAATPLAGPARDRALVRAALERGEVAEARRMIAEARNRDEQGERPDDWARLADVTTWPDAWLVAAVRCEPPDTAALDALVGRYWKILFGRCELLTMNRDRAADLAQETWSRVLRARRSLQPDGNVQGFLTTVATNIWRDWYRSARRAKQLADDRVVSLDATLPGAEGDAVPLADALPDPHALPAEEQALLRMDLDRALARLAPRARDVLVARYLDGESAAEIGARYGRTEQTVTAWLRQAIRDMRLQLGAPAPRHTAGGNGP